MNKLTNEAIGLSINNAAGYLPQGYRIKLCIKRFGYGFELYAPSDELINYQTKADSLTDEIYELIDHYNRKLLTVGSKWDHMASLPGPWGGQWHQWDMPPLSSYSGEGTPRLNYAIEDSDSLTLPGFSVFNNDSAFIDLYNSGNGAAYWSSQSSADWIMLSQTAGVIYDEKRIWVKIDWDKAPEGISVDGMVKIYWSSSLRDEWSDWDKLSIEEREDYRSGITKAGGHDNSFELKLSIFNPINPRPEEIRGFKKRC